MMAPPISANPPIRNAVCMPQTRSESLPLCCSILDSGAVVSHSEGPEICQTKASQKSTQRMRPRAASDRSISPQEFVFRCVFGRVSSQPKRSCRLRVSMRRPDLSSRERPSCILKANLCCWKKAILGWCRKAHGTVTKLSKPLLQLKRPARLRRCTVGMSNSSLARDSVPLEPLNRDLSARWPPPREHSSAAGFEVLLVAARQAKHVPGRKSDVQDCQWLQQLHTYGLLRAAFRPEDSICRLRTLQRHRKNPVECGAMWIQHIQKAINAINLHLHHVLTDISGQR